MSGVAASNFPWSRQASLIPYSWHQLYTATWKKCCLRRNRQVDRAILNL